MTRLSPRQSAVALERLRDATQTRGLDDRPDADLLDRFARYADHPAFESLLRRHGPMVLGVCRRLLANPADADDAFQATFLVLVRKARSVRRGDRLGPWLYGVAFKVASKARARSARVASRHTGTTDMLPDPSSPPESPDWLPVLDAELSALPAKYRDPLVLCELQGTTRADAAKALGIPEGTLSSRLARGRELLRRRLLKHGTLLPAGGLAALFSAHGVGRAAVPLALFTKTSELAVATGAGLAGAVPVGAARLTDEVIRGMFLTKLRAAGVVVVALGLMTAGVTFAVSGEPPRQPEKVAEAKTAPPAKPARPAEPPHAAGSADSDTAPGDRDALQGLWVLDKYDLGKGAPDDVRRQANELVGKMQFLVAGDVWWGLIPGQGGVCPHVAKIDPAKNPKWLDLTNLAGGANDLNRCIYELDGDKLRVCVVDGGDKARPAEFTTDEERIDVMHFRRDKLPPPAGEKALVGSWEGMGIHKVESADGITVFGPTPRVEILDGFLFVRFPKTGEWAGGKYTVDATKNPKWIDVDLVCPIDDKVTKLYGCYEVSGGRMRLALGPKRATRPLEFAEAPGVILLAVGQTKEPLTRPRAVDAAVPSPTPKDVPQLAPAPAPRAAADPDGERVRKLMKAGDFAGAEDVLRVALAQSAGLRAAEYRLQLGICLVERAKDRKPADADTLRSQAAGNFSLALKELDAETQPDEKRAAWVRTQIEVRTLQVLYQQGKFDELLKAAGPFIDKHYKTADGLIALSLTYHAFKEKGDQERAAKVRGTMRELFDKLKEQPGVFTAETGEYSREYWEKVWFAE